MQILLKTTSSHMYLDPYTGDEIAHNRPSVVRATEFVNGLAAAGKVKVICNELKDGTTDKDFVDFVKGSRDEKTQVADLDLAVESFLSKHAAVTEETDPAKLKAAQKAAEAERQKREKEEAAAAAAEQKKKDEQAAATAAAAAAANKAK